MDPGVRAGWAASRPTPDHPVDAACVAPWVSIEFDPSGWVYACCTSGLYPLGRIGEQRLPELWGGPRAQVMRQAMLDWDLTVACGPCRWHLEHGRMDPVAAVYDQYPVSSADPELPYMMLFALSNRCNLGCLMCNPDLSTTLRHEAGLAPLASPYDDQYFADLEPFLGGLRLAKFLGGEPFLSSEHRRVWSMMDQLAAPPRLQITTNGTVWSDNVAWVLDRFHTDISISVDAVTPETYARVRRGGDLRELWRNVDRFEETCRRRGTELHVSYCLLNENWQELADFLVWADRFAVPSSINLVTDAGLALHDAPLEALEAVRSAWERDERRLGASFGKNRSVWETQRHQLDAVIDERRAGVQPTPRQAAPVPVELFSVSSSDLGTADPDASVARHRDRLAAWSGGGPVAELVLDARGAITGVPVGHARLGISEALVGGDAASVVPAMEAQLGRGSWLIEQAELDDATVRTVILSRQRPVRGTRGTIVRTVQVRSAAGSVVLLAEDRIYEEPHDTAVEVAVALGRPSARPV